MATTMKKPPGMKLAKEGTALVTAIVADLKECGLEPDAREWALLQAAGELRDRIAALQKVVAADGVMIGTASRTRKLHPAISELRQHGVALAKVLSGVKMVYAEPGDKKSPRHVRAVQTRWDREASRDA